MTPSVCKREHALDGENLYVRPNGKWGCRACGRENMRKHLETKARLEKLHPALNRAQRLEVAGFAAPRVRDEARRTRRVFVTNAAGEVVRVAHLHEIQKGVLEFAGIELGIAVGVRPKKKICAFCGKPFAVPPKGTIPNFCGKGCVRCACGASLSHHGARKAMRAGRRPMCPECSRRRVLQARHASPQTHCKRGHAYTPEATRHRKAGEKKRICLVCERERVRAYAARQRARAAAQERVAS